MRNNFNPARSTASIVPVQEFVIYSDPSPISVAVKEEEYLAIKDLESLLREKLPQCQITGSLEGGSELSIRYETKACHIHLLDNGRICYRYGANIRNIWIILLLAVFSFFLAFGMWHTIHEHYGHRARHIGYHIQQILEDHDIELEAYTEQAEEISLYCV